LRKENPILIRALVISMLLATFASSAALASWTVTSLTPDGHYDAAIRGISDGQLAGFVMGSSTDYQDHAAIWPEATASPTDIHPSGFVASQAYGICNGQVVGIAYGTDDFHAALWTSSLGFTDLNPVSDANSVAFGTSEDQQVGEVQLPGVFPHASLWTGTAETWIDLHPAGYYQSCARGVSAGQQVGDTQLTSSARYHAALWTGSAGSWVDLNPAGYAESDAMGVSDGQQVGSVRHLATDYVHYAALWTGTAESWINLNPAGYSTSQASAASHGWQAGSAGYHAGIWHGTADSWVDLHGLLPEEYTSSFTTTIEFSGNDLWVGGYGIREVDMSPCMDAFLWHGVVPEPSSVLGLGSGVLALAELIRRRR
jgi:hypothetical protein